VLISSVIVLSFGCAVLHDVLDANLFHQPQHAPYRERSQRWTISLASACTA